MESVLKTAIFVKQHYAFFKYKRDNLHIRGLPSGWMYFLWANEISRCFQQVKLLMALCFIVNGCSKQDNYRIRLKSCQFLHITLYPGEMTSAANILPNRVSAAILGNFTHKGKAASMPVDCRNTHRRILGRPTTYVKPSSLDNKATQGEAGGGILGWVGGKQADGGGICPATAAIHCWCGSCLD